MFVHLREKIRDECMHKYQCNHIMANKDFR